MLITAKALVKHGTELDPVCGGKEALNILQSAFRWTSEVHGSNANPHWRLNIIHFEVVHSTRDPELCMFSIEFGKFELGKTTKVGGVWKLMSGNGGNSYGWIYSCGVWNVMIRKLMDRWWVRWISWIGVGFMTEIRGRGWIRRNWWRLGVVWVELGGVRDRIQSGKTGGGGRDDVPWNGVWVRVVTDP